MKVVTVLVRGGVIFAKENSRAELLRDLEAGSKERDKFYDFVHVGPGSDVPIAVRVEDILSVGDEVDYLDFTRPVA